MGNGNSSYKRPSGSPAAGQGGSYRNDLSPRNFDAVRRLIKNRRNGVGDLNGDLLPKDGMRKIYSRTWDDAEGLRIHSRYGRPVIYEYKDGEVKLQTTNPSKARVAYMEGDIFLVKELQRRWVGRLYPSLKSSGSSSSVFGLILMLVGFEEPEYTVGQRITSIDLQSKRVRTQAMIRLGGQWIPIEGKNSRGSLSEVRLNIAWNHYIVSSNMVRFANVVEVITLNVATFGAAGIGRKLGKQLLKYVGKKAAKRGLQRIFKEVLVEVLKTALICTTKFLTALAIDLEKQKSLVELRNSTGDFNTAVELNHSVVRTSAVFSNCLVDKVFVEAVTKHIPTFVSDLLGESPSMLKKRIVGAITTQIILVPTSTFFQKMSSSVSKAAADSMAGKGSFAILLPKYLGEECRAYFSEQASGWAKSIAAELTESI